MALLEGEDSWRRSPWGRPTRRGRPSRPRTCRSWTGSATAGRPSRRCRRVARRRGRPSRWRRRCAWLDAVAASVMLTAPPAVTLRPSSARNESCVTLTTTEAPIPTVPAGGGRGVGQRVHARTTRSSRWSGRPRHSTSWGPEPIRGRRLVAGDHDGDAAADGQLARRPVLRPGADRLGRRRRSPSRCRRSSGRPRPGSRTGSSSVMMFSASDAPMPTLSPEAVAGRAAPGWCRSSCSARSPPRRRRRPSTDAPVSIRAWLVSLTMLIGHRPGHADVARPRAGDRRGAEGVHRTGSRASPR